MRDPAGQDAQRVHLLRLPQLRLQPTALELCLPPLCDVETDADDSGRGSVSVHERFDMHLKVTLPNVLLIYHGLVLERTPVRYDPDLLRIMAAKKLKPGLPAHVLGSFSHRLENGTGTGGDSQILDTDRLEQEMVLFANKMDVAEELDRLGAHSDEVRHVLRVDKPTGRRLDFLMQEMNREANTLGSKSVDTAMSRASVELKVLIEQMREQIQNIE